MSAQPPGRAGLGAEARASVLAGRESGKKSAAAEEARDFFLPLCFAVREERGFRAPPWRTPGTGVGRGYQRGPQRRARAAANSVEPRDRREPWLSARTPETGTSRGYQRGPQRRAGEDIGAAAAATKGPVCESRSLSTPPLPGACAARRCRAPVVRGQLPRENARRASGCCNVTPASATAGSPHIRTPPSPRPG